MTAPSLVPLVRQVLTSPTAEPAMQRQMLALAGENVHQDGMPGALAECLPLIRASDLRRAVRRLLMALDSGRFVALGPLHDALLAELATEDDRAERAALIARLVQGVGQDQRLPPALIALLGNDLPDPEARALMAAISAVPVLDDLTVTKALAMATTRSATMQEWAVQLATGLPALTPAVLAALTPYLDGRLPATLRLGLIQRLQAARVQVPDERAVLARLARDDGDASIRCAALDLLAMRGDAEAIALIAGVAASDAVDTVRAHATTLLGRASASVDADSLTARIRDADPAVRRAALAQARPQVRQEAVRAALISAFAADAASWTDPELHAILDLLAPYAARDAALRTTLLNVWTTLPRPAQRAAVVERILPHVRVAEIADRLAAGFANEADEGLRAALFQHLRPLSLARHPALIAIFAQELADPASPFRQQCATALVAVAEDAPVAAAALADVLTHDTDRALVRICLDGYLLPRVARAAAPLLAVIDGQELDTSTRQRALEAVVKLALDADEQAQLTAILAGPGAATLKRP